MEIRFSLNSVLAPRIFSISQETGFHMIGEPWNDIAATAVRQAGEQNQLVGHKPVHGGSG